MKKAGFPGFVANRHSENIDMTQEFRISVHFIGQVKGADNPGDRPIYSVDLGLLLLE